MYSRSLLVLACIAASGCALRPRYADFVNAKTEGKEVTFVVLDAETGRPVPGAKVEVSELKNRIQTTTTANGTFKLPVEKKYVDENPVFVVTLPKEVVRYRVELFTPAPLPPPPTPNVPAEVPATDAVDAGT